MRIPPKELLLFTLRIRLSRCARVWLVVDLGIFLYKCCRWESEPWRTFRELAWSDPQRVTLRFRVADVAPRCGRLIFFQVHSCYPSVPCCALQIIHCVSWLLSAVGTSLCVCVRARRFRALFCLLRAVSNQVSASSRGHPLPAPHFILPF